MIDLKKSTAVHTVFLLNKCNIISKSVWLNDSHLRLGSLGTSYSDYNPIVKSNIFDGGFIVLDELSRG